MSWWNDLYVYYDLYLGDLVRSIHIPSAPVWAALVVGAGMIFLLWKSWHNYSKLTVLEPAPEGFEPDATVVIPARNEAENITDAVRSFTGFPVLVVDDDSSDNTAELARKAGAIVIPAPPLRKHHKGKPNACAAGAKAVTSKWILFVDADTRYEPGALAALVHFAESHKLDALSMFLRQERVTLPERMLLPYAFALYFCGVNGRKVNRTRSSDALANGQCFLVLRETYELAGGHMSVVESVIEDVALAKHLKRSRKRLRVIRGEQFGSVRMYDSFTAIWRGFEKNSFRFLLINPWTGFQVVLGSILLTSWLPVLVWLLVSGQWLTAAVFALLPIFLMRKWYGGLPEALLVPPAIYTFQLIALAGMYNSTFGHTTLWKGRRV